MKQSKIIIALACAATMFSCMKEEILETPKVSLTFNVTNEPSDSKAVLNANAVEFAAGDQIAVWDGSSMNCFETTTGGATASFSGSAASADSYILISPYSSTNYSVSGSVVTYSIPNIQVATPGGVDPNALVSMAKVSSTSEDVSLYNCVGLIKVVVPDGLTVKEIHVGGGANSLVGICGPFTFNTNTPAVNYVAAEKMLTSIALVPQPGQSVIAPGTYYIAVRPTTFAGGLTLAYVNADNQLCKRTTSKSVSVARNHILPVGTLNTTNFTPVTGRSTLRYANGTDQFNGTIKKLAGGTGVYTEDDNVVKKIVFKAHTLPYKASGTIISNGPNTDVYIYAWLDGDTAYVYTEAPVITFYSNSSDLFRSFAALEEVSFNDVNTMESASFNYLFRYCTKLKSVDFGNADFSKVTDFSYMFYTGTSALEYVDLGGTATTAATTMQAMFNNNQNLKYLNLGPNFTLASAHANMFLDAARQTSIDAGGDDDKKCQLYASQAFYNDVKANEATFIAARFTFHAQ